MREKQKRLLRAYLEGAMTLGIGPMKRSLRFLLRGPRTVADKKKAG